MVFHWQSEVTDRERSAQTSVSGSVPQYQRLSAFPLLTPNPWILSSELYTILWLLSFDLLYYSVNALKAKKVFYSSLYQNPQHIICLF